MKRFFQILKCLIVLLIVGALLALVSHGTPDTHAATHQLSVLTYNTHRMGMFRKTAHNRVIHYIRRTNADIVCLQEVEVYKDNRYLTLPELRDAMRQYPYTYYDFKVYNKRRQFGNVVFSKYPLIHKQRVEYDSRSNISSFCDVVVGTDTLRLFVNHLESNRFTRNDFHLPDSLSGDQLRESAHRISEKLGSARAIRHRQAQAVSDEIAASPHPVIVVGDFNSTPLSYAYWRIRVGTKRWLRDVFLETSWGKLGLTFVKHHMGLRIDYILCSRNLIPQDCTIDTVDYSDHYPLRATIVW